jgi:hypothetical protein
MHTDPSPLDHLPAPGDLHTYMGRLYRELALLRRLLRLAQTAKERNPSANRPEQRQEVCHAE